MTDASFRTLIENSDIFKSFPVFKQNIILDRQQLIRLKDYFQQGQKNGVAYLRQNKNLTVSYVNLIESIL